LNESTKPVLLVLKDEQVKSESVASFIRNKHVLQALGKSDDVLVVEPKRPEISVDVASTVGTYFTAEDTQAAVDEVRSAVSFEAELKTAGSDQEIQKGIQIFQKLHGKEEATLMEDSTSMYTDAVKQFDAEEEVLAVCLFRLKAATLKGQMLEHAPLKVICSQFPEDHQTLLKEALRLRNEKVTDFNEYLQTAVSCNTAVYMLSSGSAALTAMYYILNYILQNCYSPSSTSSICLSVLKSQKAVRDYPSVAEDTGTNTRTAMHALSKLIFSNNGAINEYPTMAMARISLGLPDEPVTHTCVLLNVKAAFDFLQVAFPKFKLPQFGDGRFGEYKVSAPSEGTTREGGLKMSESFVERESSTEENESDSSYDDESGRFGEKKVSAPREVITQKGGLRKSESFVEKESSTEENESDSSYDDESEESANHTDSGSDYEHDDVENEGNAENTGEGVVFPDNIDGKLVVMNLAEAFAHRPKCLRFLSLFEFVSATSILPINLVFKSNDTKEAETEEAKDFKPEFFRQPGRNPNDRFRFTQGPYRLTHAIVVHSKFKVPKFYPPPPTSPLGALDEISTAAGKKYWKKKAQAFSQFSLTVYRAWFIEIDEHGRQSVLFMNPDGRTAKAQFNWVEFTNYFEFLSSNSSDIHQEDIEKGNDTTENEGSGVIPLLVRSVVFFLILLLVLSINL